jgi:drug/metabolite transporter (DMT)-like permease
LGSWPYYNLGNGLNNSNNNNLAIFGLLFGAVCWGVIWYPYRIMAEAGVSGAASSFYTYSLGILFGCVLFAKHWRDFASLPKSAIWLAVFAGFTNLSYVLAVIDGEVMRVMLLFYLSPLWTLILARYWLKEPFTRAGLLAIGIAMIGAYIMLANPFSDGVNHWPIPQNKSEWMALSAGIAFSLSNVVTRKSTHLSLAAKSMLVCLGVAGMSLIYMLFVGEKFPPPSVFSATNWLIMFVIAVLLMATTVFVQYGVTQIAAMRASVLFLFELIVAAIASYYWANEAMTVNEWLGGALIIAAGLLSVLNHQD